MKKDMQSAIFPLEDARADAKTIDGKRFASVAERGSLKLLCSFPLRPNVQSPHDQDELYFVVRGQGVLYHDGKRDAFAAGDVMFIAAGTEHRFEDFSDDLTVWIAFYGPRGGEQITRSA